MSISTATDVLDALRRHHAGAAFVTELVVNDADVIAARRTFYAQPFDYRDTTMPDGDDEFWKPLTRRIDALLVIRGLRTAVEVKVSRADYRRETDDKRRAWRAITHRFVYAVPAGLVTPEEVPDGIGLWYVHDRPSGYANGLWTGPVEVVKRAKVNRDAQPLPDHLVHALCYRATRLEASA